MGWPNGPLAHARCVATSACRKPGSRGSVGSVKKTKRSAAKVTRDIARSVGAGHSFVITLKNAFPVNVLNAVKACPEVCRVYCATANPLQVVVAETELGRAVLGVVDGSSPKGVEDAAGVAWRQELLQKIGYKR